MLNFFDKPGAIQHSAEPAAITAFAETMMMNLPPDVAQWPFGIRQAALGFLLEALLAPEPGKGQAIDQARQKAKEAYLKMFGQGGALLQYLDDNGEIQCWAQEIRARAFNEPLAAVLLYYLTKPLPAPYAPTPATGVVPSFAPVALNDFVQIQIMSAALLAVLRVHGALQVSISELAQITKEHPGLDLNIEDGFLRIKLQ